MTIRNAAHAAGGGMETGREEDERGPKERVYDAEISPLMTQIIAICKRAGIPVHASFALDGDLACTTHIAPALKDVPADDREDVARWLRKYDPVARQATEPAFFAYTITSSTPPASAPEVEHG